LDHFSRHSIKQTMGQGVISNVRKSQKRSSGRPIPAVLGVPGRWPGGEISWKKWGLEDEDGKTGGPRPDNFEVEDQNPEWV
jgi:hypothetical protein